MEENLGSFLIYIIMLSIIIYALVQEYRSSRCPKCKADYFNIARTKEDYLGEDFANPEKRIFRNYYSCEKCNHEWIKDIYRSKSGENYY
ncbi:DUF6671 family protein [Aquimarina sp. AU58]|uniref:DUF6671 family protein n=1 Tax=Aquimarina sp. AU58 TaxID=1874112 RepID=UPI000D6E7145|nr:DUF6671 family protein [Aquimarina sp. AU58]